MYDDRKDIPAQDVYRSAEVQGESTITTNFTMRDPDDMTGNESGGNRWEPAHETAGQAAVSQTGDQMSGRSPEDSRSSAKDQSAGNQPAGNQGTGSQSAGSYIPSSQFPDSHGWERQYNRMNTGHIPQEPQQHFRKKKPAASKIAGITAAALLFGTVAGGTMFGVNSVGEYLSGRNSQQVEQAETQPSVAAAETQPSAQANAPVSNAIQMDVSGIVEQAMPSVVAINNTMVYQQQTFFGQRQAVEVPSSGSGIIVGQNDDELLIVTNNHVVADSKELSVTFIDDAQVTAAIKGTDSESDLAVIAVPLKDIPAESMAQIKVAVMGDSDALKVGQGVIAIGNALGYGQSVTVGYVGALDREVRAEDQTVRNLLQTDAAINPGNSGGALLNMNGEVIGINAAKYSSTEVEGMGYAIPINKAQEIISELMTLKTRVVVDENRQGYLGIQTQNINEDSAAMFGMPKGIYVYKIVEGGAAAASSLREKDIITKFDSQTVRTMADLKDMLTYYEGGDTIVLTVQSLENGQYVERTVEITLGYKPAAETN